MKTLLITFLFLVFVDVGLSQHYEWTVSLMGGKEFSEVHPDSIWKDSLVVSTSTGTVSWLSMGSIRTLSYDYNPVLITLTMMGGMIGGTAGNNGNEDRKAASIGIGLLSGVAVGYFIGDVLGVHDEVEVASLPPDERNQILAQRVARWSGKLKIIP